MPTSALCAASRSLAIVSLTVVALACSSGGDSSTGTPTTPTAPGTNIPTGGNSVVATTTAFTAVIGGQPWAPTTATYNVSLVNGVLTMAGTSTSGLTLGLTIPLPGTIPGEVPLSSGANAILTSSQGQSWSATWLDGGSATIRVNSYTSSSVSGTFTLLMIPMAGASGTRSVTQGQFNMSF